jgi:SSS family solute:Na+ symporter
MLHRGKYRLEGEQTPDAGARPRSLLSRVLNIDENFTRGDKVLTIGTFIWTMLWKVVALGVLIWTLCVAPLSKDWWFDYTMITGVWLTLVVAVVVTIWFGIGITRDLIDLFALLKTAQRVDADDGSVKDHHNVGEAPPSQALQSSAPNANK